MDILICKQGLFGGTDKLLGRLYDWLWRNKFSVDLFCMAEDEVKKLKERYDVVILPSSQIGDISILGENGISIKRMLVWIMGMGAFSDSYYTYPPNGTIDKLLCRMYQKEAVDTLGWLINNDAIIFTDSVGIYNTIKTSGVSSIEVLKENIVPIAIECPDDNQWKLRHHNKGDHRIRISWVGRVAKDFKEIPILHLLDDVEEYLRHKNANIELIIVGDGDAIHRVKEKASGVSYPISFIDNIPYDELNEYIAENVDLLVAMGTSALDGAKNGCPTVVITPVRPNDPERVDYRWIYDSVGYSLGEFPNIDIETGQPRFSFEKIMDDFDTETDISEKCLNYAHEFDMNVVFDALINREAPGEIDAKMIKHIEKFKNMKIRKSLIKKLLKKES